MKEAGWPAYEKTPEGAYRLVNDAVDFWIFAGDATDCFGPVRCPFGGPGDTYEGTWIIVALGAERGENGWEWVIDAVPRERSTYERDPERGRLVAAALGLVPNCPACKGEGSIAVAPMDRMTCPACNGKRWAG
jgi:hypothetical protein